MGTTVVRYNAGHTPACVHSSKRRARHNTAHGSGLGRFRWVVERTFAWLHHL
jgi:transposase